MKKLPPKEKVYEAFTALADDRVKMYADHAEVDSSDGNRHYTVNWKDNMYASSDPATYWQSYPGYPVIAVWLKQGILTCDMSVIPNMKGIPWHKLNDEHKRDYAAALAEAVRDMPDKEKILAEGEKVNAQIAGLDIVLKRKISSSSGGGKKA